MLGLGLRGLGFLIVLLGAWGGIVPYVGPLFGYATPAGSAGQAFQWTAPFWELNLLPGIAAILGGLLLMGAGRGGAALGALLALVAGIWLVLGPVFAPAWLGTGVAVAAAGTGSTLMRIATPLGYHYGTGILIAALAALALGVLPGRRVRLRA